MAGLYEGDNEPPGSLKSTKRQSACIERIPNLTGEQSDGITVFRISPMTSLMLHRCRTGAINLQSEARRFAGEIASICYVTKDAVPELINGRETSKTRSLVIGQDSGHGVAFVTSRRPGRNPENGIIFEQHQGLPTIYCK
ncbi:hypothetical protein ANN_17099 [Periplaneta americana]|uniref:Per a allergen n=1 Tax=Periplaneta americana TaxID=6978 RepID=A0ABQ8STE6_PERAM|nr:hypothetical protein ANN_17099 [Periplaneta americana]